MKDGLSYLNYYGNISLSEIEEGLKRALGQYKRHNVKLYVGMTGEPERRYMEHCRDKACKRMVVVLETSTMKTAIGAENLLIKQGRKYSFNILENQKGPQNITDNFVYILLDKKKGQWNLETPTIKDLSGPPNRDISSLKSSVGQYSRHSDYIYIGKTGNPSKRLSAHQRLYEPQNKWDVMHLLYYSSSPQNAAKVERDLIRYVKGANYYEEKVINQNETNLPNKWYVYVAVL